MLGPRCLVALIVALRWKLLHQQGKTRSSALCALPSVMAFCVFLLPAAFVMCLLPVRLLPAPIALLNCCRGIDQQRLMTSC